MEAKAWGQGWNSPEDSGTYQIEGKERKWYFLWTTDEHKYSVEIKPTNAVNYVTSVTISPFGNATKNTGGDWELTVSNPTIGTHIDTVASASVNGRSCESEPVDIAVHALQSVGWDSVTGGAEINGNKIYPEKPSATASAQKEVNVVASIDRLPSAGMKGTVHLKRLLNLSKSFLLIPIQRNSIGYLFLLHNIHQYQRTRLLFGGIYGQNEIKCNCLMVNLLNSH